MIDEVVRLRQSHALRVIISKWEKCRQWAEEKGISLSVDNMVFTIDKKYNLSHLQPVYEFLRDAEKIHNIED